MHTVSRRRRPGGTAALVLAALAVSAPAGAQVTLTTVTAPPILEQPAGVARHEVRLRLAPAWTRYDEWFDGSTGLSHQLGSGLATDSLGVAQLPVLLPYQSALATLTGDPTAKLSLGRLTAGVSGRIMTLPISVDYGVTSRLTLTAVVPIVQTRTRVGLALNNSPSDSTANVGVAPASWTASSQVATDFASAAQALQAQIQNCQANPADPGCASINADPGSAAALAQTLTAFGGAVTTLYGSSASAPGPGFVPLTGSPALAAANGQIASLNTDYRRYMGQDVTARTLPGATARLATGALEQLFASPSVAGYDSLGTVEQYWIGDVALGATLQLVAPSRDSTSAVLWRSSVQSFVRLPTGRVARGDKLFEVGTGDGRLNVDVRGLVDVLFARRLGLGVGAQYTRGFGEIAVARAPFLSGDLAPVTPKVAGTWTPGNALQVDASPRFLFTPNLSLLGYYSFRHRGDDRYDPSPTLATAVVPAPLPVVVPGATEQRAGIGFGYGSSMRAGRRQMPLDARFMHTELLIVSGGPAIKTSRDEVRVRIYY